MTKPTDKATPAKGDHRARLRADAQATRESLKDCLPPNPTINDIMEASRRKSEADAVRAINKTRKKANEPQVMLIVAREQSKPKPAPIRIYGGAQQHRAPVVIDHRHFSLAAHEQAQHDLDQFLKRYAELKAVCRQLEPARRMIDAEVTRLRRAIASTADDDASEE
jgi:hypothetical protein